MTRKTSTLDEQIESPAPTTERAAKTTNTSSIEEKLDLMLLYMHRMDKRDRLRTIGGFVHGLLALIPIILVVWSAWYFYAHGTEFMEQITREAVKQSAEYSQGSLMEQLEQYMDQGR